jgi:hypothetical protein
VKRSKLLRVHLRLRLRLTTFSETVAWTPTVLHVNGGFFLRAIEMRRKRNIGAECECIGNSMVTFFFISPYI